MLFNSFAFLIFMAIVLATYYRLQHRSQNAFLLCASYIFYGWWDWRFVSLLLLSTVIDYYCARMIGVGKRRKLFLLLSVTSNLTILGFFKYFNFFSESLQALFDGLGWYADIPTLNVILPVGISFYTFQSLSYTVDVYRHQLEPSKDLLDVALYVSFFPQLVAGPIERAVAFLPQVQSTRRITETAVLNGIWLILIGYVKKTVIADRCAQLVDPCFAGDSLPFAGAANWLVLYAFAFQIYGDFSGYTDIARGVAKLLGFDLMLNFAAPYLVSNPSAFWRNWHISLSTWLRDYLYIPLGGNRCSAWRNNCNLMVTMGLGGLWHGAGWAYLFWGIFHGLLLVMFRDRRRTEEPSRPPLNRLWQFLAVIAFFHISCLGWLLFRTGSLPPSMDQVAFLRDSFVTLTQRTTGFPWPLLQTLIPMAVLVFFFQRYHERMDNFSTWSVKAQSMGFALGTCLLLILGAFRGTGFIYFQF